MGDTWIPLVAGIDEFEIDGVQLIEWLVALFSGARCADRRVGERRLALRSAADSCDPGKTGVQCGSRMVSATPDSP
jgi:hypothetical protein